MQHHLLDTALYLLNPLAIQTLSVALGVLCLGIYALGRERDSPVSVVFFLLTLAIAVWLFAFTWMYSAKEESLAMWWARVAYVGIAFIPGASYHYSAMMLKDNEKVRLRILSSWMLGAFFLILIVSTDLQFGALYHYPWGFYPRYGLTSIPFLLYFAGSMGHVLHRYLAGYRRVPQGSPSLMPVRLRLVAFAIGCLGAVDFAPSFGLQLYPFGFVPIFLSIGLSVHAIVRYRFMPITPAFAARQIIDTMNDALIVLDRTGVIRLVNRAACALFGCSEQDLAGKQLSTVEGIPFRRELESVIQGAEVRSSEATYRLQNSPDRILSLSASVMSDPIGELLAVVCVVRDITELKGAEERLRNRNAFIESILNKLPIGLAVNSISDGMAIYLNEKFTEIYGWPMDVLGDVDDFFRHVYPDPVQREKMREKILSDIASGDPARMLWNDIPITSGRGETKYVTAVNIPLPAQDLMISTVQDVTERVSAQKALIDSEKRYRRLIESVTDYLYAVKIDDGRPSTVMHGPGCLAVTGYGPEEYGADPDLWHRIVHPGDRDLVAGYEAKMLSGRPMKQVEHRIIHKDGSLRWVRNTAVLRFDRSGRLVDYDGLITDITPLKQLEAQLRQAQKMEAVGQLAGGVAHDFNNILTAIVGYGNLLVMKLTERDGLSAYARQILASADRAAHLTRSLLAFSRKQVIELKPVDINAVIGQVETMLARIIGEDIEFETKLHPQDLPVLADSVQLEQVLMNLAANARDAMSEGGLLTIETGFFEMGEDFLKTHGYGRPGTYASVIVTDTGSGIDEEIRAKIFEPFFTTKEVGKGTGLGLAMAYGIIKQHNGYIKVSSVPAQGTTFKIYLPLLATELPGRSRQATVCMQRGTETVLLAEDDGEVRKLVRMVLEDAGYTVIEAVDGVDALEKFRGSSGIDLVVSDIIMPKKNGIEMYQELQRVRPGIKALFTSGYTSDSIRKKGILTLDLDIIQKPISPREFLQHVRRVLEKT
jgi:PAS domain S-box-containing protein